MKNMLIAIIGLLYCVVGVAKPAEFIVTKDQQHNMTIKMALKKLQNGNMRYLAGDVRKQDYKAQAYYAAEHGQHPFAFILNCMDSRSIPAIAFDQGVGNLFTASVAGNVVDTNMIASMEYAVHVGVKLLVIMGHTQCGAMEAACMGAGFGKITDLVKTISPAVTELKKSKQKLDCKDPNVINKIAINNVYNMMNQVMLQSPYLAKRINDHSIMLVGALHNIKTGKVTYFHLDDKAKSK